MVFTKKDGVILGSVLAGVVCVGLLVYFLTLPKYEYDAITNTCKKSKNKEATSKSTCQKLLIKAPKNEVSYTCNTLSGECEVAAFSDGVSLDACKSVCTKTVVPAGVTYYCDRSLMKCMQSLNGTGVSKQECAQQCQCVGSECAVAYKMLLPNPVTATFSLATAASQVVGIHAFYTMGTFVVPADIHNIKCNVGYDVVFGTGSTSKSDTLLTGLVLLEAQTAFTKQLENIETNRNLTVQANSDKVKNVMTGNPSSIFGFPGTVPDLNLPKGQVMGWIAPGQATSLSSTATIIVTPGKKYIVCAYLGVATKLAITLTFDKYANTITFLA